MHNNSEIERKRLYNMGINALIGYSVTETAICFAKILNIVDIRYIDILFLAVFVNGITLFFLLILGNARGFSLRTIRVFFYIQLMVYFSSFFTAVIIVNNLRLVMLIYALLAVCSLLPFSTVTESVMVSLSSVAAQAGATYYSIFYLHYPGQFAHEMFYTVSFCPVLIMISFVARQINMQRERIGHSKRQLEELNRRLTDMNVELEKANRIASNEIELATQLQNSFLPEIPGEDGNWEIALSFKPKYGVSGDFYDFYTDKGELDGIAVFDVSGHGFSSALLTMIVKPIASRIFKQMKHSTLSEIINNVNASVSSEISGLDDYITCIMLRLGDNEIEYVNAGHPDLIVRSAGTAYTRIVEKPEIRFKGEPLGINLSGISAGSLKFSVSKGDCLLLCTDCIIDSRNMNREPFGQKRLIQSLQEAPEGSSREILNYILARFHDFTSGVEIRDDFTVILLKKVA